MYTSNFKRRIQVLLSEIIDIFEICFILALERSGYLRRIYAIFLYGLLKCWISIDIFNAKQNWRVIKI